MDCIYFVQVKHSGPIKIGKVLKIDNFENRFGALQTACPYPLKALHIHENGPGNAGLSEKSLHALFEADKIHHEWFKPSKRILNFINDLKESNDLAEYGFLNSRTHFVRTAYNGGDIDRDTPAFFGGPKKNKKEVAATLTGTRPHFLEVRKKTKRR
jgi:hypothetical protein